METNNGYEMMQTKVNKETYQRLKVIQQKIGLTDYSMIQMMCDCIRRYMDDRYNLTPAMEKIIRIFESFIGWEDALNLADPSVGKEIAEATYYIQDPEGKKKGTRAVHVTMPLFGNWQEDVNIQHILDRTIKNLTPDRYNRLMELSKELGCGSLLELLDKFIEYFSNHVDMEELRTMFEDCNRSDYGTAYAYGQRTKRKFRKDMDIMFDKEDK